MNLGRVYLVGGVAIAAMLALGLWGLTAVGPDAVVPVHWGPTGEADGWAPAWVGFLAVPLLTAGLVAVLAVVPRLEPRRENLRRSGPAYRTVGIALILMVTVVQAGIVLSGVGLAPPMGLLFGVLTGALFAVTGNVLGTVRSNYLFGVRTPWTLASERAWDRTHRAVGRLMVVSGILLVVASLSGSMPLVIALLAGSVVALLVASIAVSYRAWRDDPDRRPLARRRPAGPGRGTGRPA